MYHGGDIKLSSLGHRGIMTPSRRKPRNELRWLAAVPLFLRSSRVAILAASFYSILIPPFSPFLMPVPSMRGKGIGIRSRASFLSTAHNPTWTVPKPVTFEMAEDSQIMIEKEKDSKKKGKVSRT